MRIASRAVALKYANHYLSSTLLNRNITRAFYEIFGDGKNYDEVINGVKKYITELPVSINEQQS